MNRFWILSLALAAIFPMLPAAADELIFRGNLHSSINNATLSINALGQLVVDNIGPDGRDGVAITLGQAESFDVHVVPQPFGLSAGASERFTSWGTVSGTPNLRVASMGFTQGMGSLAVDASFAALGAPPKLIEVRNAGVLVGTFTMPGTQSQIASVPASAWPRLVGVRRNLDPHSRPAVLCRWPGPLPISVVGGPVFSGDELRVVAMTPSNTLDLIAQTDGTGSDVPELFIGNEDTQPTCPGDLDGDGDVDVADLAILLANFGAIAGVSAADGDLDRDGDVDVADLAILLANYGTIC